MTTAITQNAGIVRSRPSRPRPGPRWLGALPGVLALVVAVGTLLAHDTPPRDVALFAAYVALGVTVPGTLLWRALTRLSLPTAVDLAAGTALGYVLEIFTYMAARAAGQPRLAVLGPALVILTFLAVPRLRRHWRSAEGPRIPFRYGCAMSAVFCYLVVSSGLTFFRGHGLSWPGNAAPYMDMPFHISLVGELRHHMPPTVPQVLGEPLSYHWFVYADMAATSWATGIEAQTLLFRLTTLPMWAVFVVLVPAAAFMITRSWLPGVLALAAAYLLAPPNPYAWLGGVFDVGTLNAWAWLSPTQTFGAALFGALVLLVIGLLREGGQTKTIFVPVTVLLVALSGAKATYLPLLLAGVCLLVAVDWIRSRRVDRNLLLLAAVTLATLAFAQFVLFGGASQGMRPWPFSTVVRQVGAWPTKSLIDEVSLAPIVVSATFLLAWAALWAGVFGPRRDPGSGSDRTLTLFLGIGLGALGAVLLLGHPGMSQLYFLAAARPYLWIVAAVGVLAALDPVPRRLRPLLVVAAIAAGTAVLLLSRAAGDPSPPELAELGDAGLSEAFILPFGVLALIVIVVAVSLRRVPWRRAAVLLLVTGLSAPSAVLSVTSELTPTSVPTVREIPEGGIEAARWLRDHSDPGDVVATNAHCRLPTGRCDSRHFWMSAYAERRVLVEGWCYTAKNLASLEDVNRQSMAARPFWDGALLAANDAAFSAPTAQAVRSLRERYGVRWLVADRGRKIQVAPDLDAYATLRFSKGQIAVYEITG
ncbi:hypothetical protein AB0B45_23895 [Nonomuraea sp. NPDC049152]|uniref:hypothetical protein n=1 Tax=Nonomuraea sp. NPDC049152 TaxID=3154350 RepID=UPI0033DBAB14